MMRATASIKRWLTAGKFKWILAVGVVAVATGAGATPPLGFVVNQILASGLAGYAISQHVQLNRNPDGSVTPWQLQLEVRGDTDYYAQHLVLVPAGYSGWHSHPGLLIGTVKSGQIDFYTDDCVAHTITAGQVFTENDAVHGIYNSGSVDADLYISYLVKHGQPRRREEAAPACAYQTPIP